MRKNDIKKRILQLIYINLLLLKSYTLDSDEFDRCNDKISLLYNKLINNYNLTRSQIDKIIIKLLKKN